jgi:chromosome segregation ATPase
VENSSGAEVRVEANAADPHAANFFVAVCALAPQTGAPTFVHIPSSGNILRERDRHIQLLEGELKAKNDWLDSAQREHETLVGEHRALEQELEERNRWAEDLNTELGSARADIERLNQELTERASSYEGKIAELDREKAGLAADLEAKLAELTSCVKLLDERQVTIEERTAWALSLDQKLRELEAQIGRVAASRWVKLGRRIGVGPDLLQK